MDEVIEVISPPPDTLNNCVACTALHLTPQPERMPHLPELQAQLPEYPVTSGQDPLQTSIFQQMYVLVRRVARKINGTISEGADRQVVKPITGARPPLSDLTPSSRSCNTLQWRDRKKDPAELPVSASL